MPTLTPVDRWFFLGDTPEIPMQASVLVTYSLPPSAPPDFVSQLVNDMRAERRFAPPFNYRLRRPRLRRLAPSWVELPDAEIDLDYHLRHVTLPAPGGEPELCALVSELASRPLDPEKPLWEVYVIDGLSDRRFAYLMKGHHAIMDGVGVVSRVTRMSDVDPTVTTVRPIWTLGPTRPRRASTPSVRHALSTAGALVKAAGALIREGYRPTDPAFATPFACPPTFFNKGRLGAQRHIALQSFDLERIRAVARAYGVSLNEVLLALCAGGLRRYLAELGELPERSLQAVVPVSVRTEGDEATANALSAVLVRLRTDLSDPAARIRAIGESSQLAKRNLRALPKAAADLYGALVLGPIVLQQLTGLAGRGRPLMNLLVSSVPGPPEPLYLRGAPMCGLYGSGPVAHGHALNVSALAVCGRYNLTFTGCRKTLPHLQHLALHTSEALAEYEAALAKG